ncbi:MAG: hypothetical protein R3F39_23265 [Myxococcota bacterium]
MRVRGAAAGRGRAAAWGGRLGWLGVVVAAAVALGAAGCDGGGAAAGADVVETGDSADAGVDTNVISPVGAYSIHEWGTLTSFQGSDGVPVAGAVIPEEALPGFVVRDSAAAGTALPAWRLQAPAFYVHAAVPGRLELALEVSGGRVLAAWPPPSPSAAGDSSGNTGRIAWSLDVGAAADVLDPLAISGSVWDPLRAVDAALVKTAGVSERFLYYEAQDAGAGADLPLAVSSADSETITATNTASGAAADRVIPMAWYVWVHGGGGLIASLGPIEGTRSFIRLPTPKELDVDVFELKARGALEADLASLGLRADEAHALVDAWDHSVFRTHGRRLIYVMPPAWAAEHVSVALDPAPEAHVRVWLGRVEFMLPSDEVFLLADLRAQQQAGAVASDLPASLGPFAAAKLARARGLIDADDPLAAWLAGALDGPSPK